MTTFATLKADITEFTARSDLQAPAATFIRLGEAEINRRARFFEQETDTTFTFNAGNSFTVAVPTGFLGFRHLFAVDSSNPKCEYTPPDLFHRLNNLPQDAFNQIHGDAGVLYTLESGSVKIQAPVGAPDDIVLDGVYYKRFLPLSDSNTTNYALTNHYDLYLWASLRGAWEWADDTEMVARYTAHLDRVITQIEAEEIGRKQAAGPMKRRPPNIGV